MRPTAGKSDYTFYLLLGLLLAVGFAALVSASAPLGAQKFQDGFHYVKRQFLFGLVPGLIAFFLASRLDYRIFRRFWPYFFGVTLIALSLVFIPGIRADWGTSHSWINVFGFSFQPIEVAKVTVALALAGWLEAVGERRLADPRQGLMPFLVGLGLVAGMLMAQPDTGGVLVVASMAMAAFLVAGAPWLHLGTIIGLGAAGLYAVIKAAPYRMARFMTFLHPEKDPLGSGYHINQAFLAIGSGGLLGVGLGHSRQKFLYLPEVAGDSVMAVMAEELGLVMMIAFLALFAAFVVRGLTIARRSQDDFGRYLAVALTAWVASQAFFNIGSMIGLMPMTGLPFPFVSYGGTALFATLGAMGLIASVARHSGTRPIAAGRAFKR
jgi:cell division protein FtsW